ncbi:MAG: hypothetical protein HYY96_02250 [Candidatus Tectomicrobia bacterium]|nr:hypothetical protein [Candidatus Tectomicrobia bacterium]
MDFLAQEQTVREALQTILSNLTLILSQDLVRTNELGTELDFSDGLKVFDRTLALFRSLQDANLDNVPLQRLQELKSLADEASQHFKDVQTFSSAGQDKPKQARDQRIRAIAEQYNNQFQSISPIIAYSVRKGTDFQRLEEDARKTVAEAKEIRDGMEKESKEWLAQIEDTQEKVRRAAAEVGVAQHAIHFSEEAIKYRKQSIGWLIVTGCLSLITILYGLYNAWNYTWLFKSGPSILTTEQTIQIAMSKLVVFAVLYYGLIWSGRIYKAQRHNYVINRHRQNALSTFETFVKAASDDGTKNAVLIQATQSIFSPQNSGFLSKDSEPSASPKILEIIRNAIRG